MRNTYLFIMTASLIGFAPSLESQPLPNQGELIITEIMANPEAVSDTNGEWFEIWNATDHDLMLNGLIIRDAGSNKHTMTSDGKLIIAPGQYWILARNTDTMTNGRVDADYCIRNFTLNNTSDQVIICLPNETVIDQVIYTTGWPTSSGASMELHPDHLNFTDNDLSQNWFAATMVFGSGDRGTPGRANAVSTVTEGPEREFNLTLYPNPSQGRFILSAEFPTVLSGEIRMINMVGQDFIYRKFQDLQVLDEVIEPAFLSPGLWFLEVRAGGYTRIARLFVD